MQPADERALHRVEAAEDHRRQRPEGDEHGLLVDRAGLLDRRLHGEDAADGGEHRTGGPGDREHPPDVDALGHRRFLVVGDRPHRDAHARAVEEVHGDERDRGGDHRRDVRPVDDGARRRRTSLLPHGTASERNWILTASIGEHAQHDLEAERDDGHREQRLADHRPDRQALDDEPEHGGERPAPRPRTAARRASAARCWRAGS